MPEAIPLAEVLAFCEPPPAHGGSGAVIVLLDRKAGV